MPKGKRRWSFYSAGMTFWPEYRTSNSTKTSSRRKFTKHFITGRADGGLKKSRSVPENCMRRALAASMVILQSKYLLLRPPPSHLPVVRNSLMDIVR
ncbi:hypothetical protein AVEN_252981-1 [Araneus ventricosus]|uniref:Uncharacterized protein n=1 Tax=Araneus ventricosus TaxID=182803 RepID=A0A4Y2W7T5_ARAVE|nr:hypothetical protein AVEN_252981-1 [Araneus ventricosus]